MNKNDNITTLKGLGPKKAECFNRMSIETIGDLVYFLPKRYNDKRHITPVSQLQVDETAFIKVIVTRVIFSGRCGRRSPLIIKTRDKSGALDIIFFNSKYLAAFFKAGLEYTFYGKVVKSKNGYLQMVQPDFELYEGDALPGIEPVYRLTKGLSQKDLRKFQKLSLPAAADFEEWLPTNVVKDNNLCDISFALNNIHFPEDESHFKAARYRLIFEELFVFQLGLSIIKRNGLTKKAGAVFADDDCEKAFIESLQFALTPGQEKAWEEIKGDLTSANSMNRLLQGDVGSGKTILAEIAAFKASKSGYQSAIMVPTEILAKQHFETFKRDLEPFGIRAGLLCSSLKSKEKKQVLDELAAGEIDILIGTHAIIEDGVKFQNLGFIATDEQHRFGVNQRNKLNSKGEGANVLIMTATPIPRTLAVILYGDLDISLIKTMPVGRLPVLTESLSSNSRRTVYSKVLEELTKGHQAYVVAPLIEESETLDVLSAEELYEDITKKFPKYSVGLLHGNLSQEEKDQVMDQFLNKEIDVLVSTVVVEVGVNVPNATVMVIEGCERFGLAQLHQLRGRVGRGSDQSYCYLVYNNLTDICRQRCETLCRTNDGFEIAEEDLKMRGPGDFFGTKQHGLPELRNADLINHFHIFEKIKPQIDNLLSDDPALKSPENQGLKAKLVDTFNDNGTITI